MHIDVNVDASERVVIQTKNVVAKLSRDSSAEKVASGATRASRVGGKMGKIVLASSFVISEILPFIDDFKSNGVLHTVLRYMADNGDGKVSRIKKE